MIIIERNANADRIERYYASRATSMDFILSVVITLMIASLLVVFVLNRVKRTTRLDELLKDLLWRQPSTVAFSLGYDRARGLYKNATISSEGGVTVRYDANPIARDGSFIVLKEHGTIRPNDDNNGYRMSGMDTVHMLCPPGYEGLDCRLKPLCEPGDAGKNKPLTYTQFNGLGLYRNDFRASTVTGRRKRDARGESVHPRIRVHCLANGEYELQTCPDGKLLDAELRCQPYDICSDRMNGFRHVYPTSTTAEPLRENEYYVCDRNRSVRRKCSDGTVYSAALNNCVVRSVCYGRGNDTLLVDEYNYIQCSADTGRKIHCEFGVSKNAEDGRLSCRLGQHCTPRIISMETDMLRYDYGEIGCDLNGESTERFCDNRYKQSPHMIIFDWVEYVKAEPYKDWPKEVLQDSKCTRPTDSIVKDQTFIVNLRYTDLMPREYPYAVKGLNFYCSQDEFRLNYTHNAVYPRLPTGRYIQAAKPCHKTGDLLTLWQLPWRNYEPVTLGPRPKKPVALVNVGYDLAALAECRERLWPVKRASDGMYCFARIRDERTADGRFVYVIEQCEDTELPVGFDEPTSESFVTPEEGNRLLRLRGYGQPPSLEVAMQNVWYTLATGEYDIVRSRHELLQGDAAGDKAAETTSSFKIAKRTELECPPVVRPTEKNRTFGIMWTHLDSKWQNATANLQVSRLGIKSGQKTYAPGFFALKIVSKGNATYVTFRDLKLAISSSLSVSYQTDVVTVADDDNEEEKKLTATYELTKSTDSANYQDQKL